jgi:hypothetical protein
MDKEKQLETAKRVGGIVIEYKNNYKHFKSIEDLIVWAKECDLYAFKPIIDPDDGQRKVIPYFIDVNFIAQFKN